MRIGILPARELTEEHILRWAELQELDPALASPYFRPEFTLAVASVREDVEVALIEDRGDLVGFFPYQRGAWNIGRPVGGRLSDFHGAILAPDVELDAGQLIQACGLAAWDFDHLPVTQDAFAAYQQPTEGSQYLDLSQGFESYREERRAAGTSQVKDALKKGRLLERDVGPLRLVPYESDPRVFAQLLEWKSAQYLRTGYTNVFGFEWTVELLRRVVAEPSPEFRGALSALYAGDHLVAVDLALHAGPIRHSWFPAYDPEFSRYSPGCVLLVEIARAAESLGIRRIDLGKGDDTRKRCFASGVIPLAEGTVECQPLARLLRGSWRQTRDWVHSSPFVAPVKLAASLARPVREWFEFH